MSGLIEDTASALVAAGVDAAFGVPGSGDILALIVALERGGVPFHGVAHEGAGAMMAAAYARQSGRLASAVSIRGPGLANMLPGLLAARYEGWPLITIAEAYGPGRSPFRMHKRLDQRRAVGPFAKAYATLGDPAATVARLAACARAEVPGPVHLDLFAEPGEPVWAEDSAVPAANPSAREAIRRALSAARRPVVVAGSLATRRGWGGRLAALRVPVLTTVAAKGVVDERAPWSAGVFTGEGGPAAPETTLLAAADLAVGLGLRSAEVLTVRPLPPPLLALDVCPTPGGEGWSPAVHAPELPPAEFDDVLDRLSGVEWGRDEVEAARGTLRRRLLTGEWLPGPVFEVLGRELPPGSRLAVDTGLFCTVAEHVWDAADWRAFVASANGRYMGTAIPMALGVTLADPRSPTVCAIGDGGFAHVVELRLAVARRLPLLLLFLSDGRYGSLAAAPSARGVAPALLRPPPGSWVPVMAAMGFAAFAVSTLGQVEDAVRGWRPTDRPLFLEAVFEPEGYAAMTKGVR